MRLKELAKDLENQRLNNNDKGKKVLSYQTETAGDVSEGNSSVSGTYNQEKLDEMLAASLAAEEDGNFVGDAGISNEEDDDDEDEEMMLPIMNGKVDPAVLAALPPSMQLDLLVQMREKLMAENRQKYQKVKKAPAEFSELQIQAYLKTVAFRREIDEVQKSAAGRGVGGVQTSRIASEANREYIFSSSFTGDKEALTNGGVEKNGDKQYQIPTECPPDSPNNVASTSKSNTAAESVAGEPASVFNDDVETYLDERGRVRVSRVRAMGIRMTRDLQRNLDLMKEIEQDRTNEDNNGIVTLNKTNEQSIPDNGASIEISFEDDGEHNCLNGDDELFASLVAGNPVIISSSDAALSNRRPADSASDSDWEEGIIEEKGGSCIDNVGVEIKPSVMEERVSDDSEVEWEEGPCDVSKNVSACPSKFGNPASKGRLEEETDLQEAIRRSLEDLGGEKAVGESFKDSDIKEYDEKVHEVKDDAFRQENDKAEQDFPLENLPEQNGSFCKIVDVVEKLDSVDGMKTSQSIDASGRQLTSLLADNPHKMEVLNNELCEEYQKDVGESGNVGRETNEVYMIREQLSHASKKSVDTSTLANSCSGDGSHISDAMLGNMPDATPADSSKYDSEAAPTWHSNETTDPAIPPGETCIKGKTAVEQKLAEGNNHVNFFMEKERNMGNSVTEDKKNVQFGVTEDVLEEMMILDQECLNLGDEQRKLERNADCVSSEMFAECQELLQMFGLPYIIAPMEAEAQCAYMELANLVDGVVTDDSDVFLFGARSVYKNIFDERKYVETYFMKDIETELGLNREKLIRMALLLGSDYTEGVSGIGIVNAIEVLNSFPEEDGLHKFREWVESPDPNILGKVNVETGSSSRKRGSKDGSGDQSHSKNNMDAFDENVSQNEHNESVDDIQSGKQIFMDKHRNVSKNWHIPSSFPSETVISAYASPQVDQSTEPFSWGKPDLFVLRKLCWEKFGWGNQKADELLLPVLKEYNKHETQLRLEAFYTFNERFAKIRSKRIKKAVKGITGSQTSELLDDAVQEGSKRGKRSRESPSKLDNKQEIPINEIGSTAARNGSNATAKTTPKQSRRRRIRKPVPSDGESAEPPAQAGQKQCNDTGSRKNGRGKGRKKGRGVRRGRGRGRIQENPGSEISGTSSSDCNSGNEEEVPAQKLDGSNEVRRSKRPRKAVNYANDDVEIDDEGKSLDQGNQKCTNEEAREHEPSRDQIICGDAAADFSGKNQQKAEDSSPGEDLCGDYPETEGVMCMDENEIGQLDSRDDDPTFADEYSEDYLKMGGGFCLEEDEKDKDHNARTYDPAKADTIFENPDPESELGIDLAESVSSLQNTAEGFQSEPTCQPDTELNLDCPNATIGLSMPENTGDDTGTNTVKALRAMPFLRKKRRLG